MAHSPSLNDAVSSNITLDVNQDSLCDSSTLFPDLLADGCMEDGVSMSSSTSETLHPHTAGGQDFPGHTEQDHTISSSQLDSLIPAAKTPGRSAAPSGSGLKHEPPWRFDTDSNASEDPVAAQGGAPGRAHDVTLAVGLLGLGARQVRRGTAQAGVAELFCHVFFPWKGSPERCIVHHVVE